MSTDLISINQFNAFGARVRNARVASPHVAQGLVTMLAAAHSAELSLSRPRNSKELDKLVEGWRDQLSAHWGQAVFKLPEASAVRALGIAATKHGPLSLSPNVQTAYPLDDERAKESYERLVRVGRSHIKEIFGRDDLPREAHLALADVLGIDGRFKISGAHTPTTPGPALIDYDSNYTLALLHAPTALGLILSADGGEQIVRDLAKVIAAGDDPHTRLLELLSLAEPRGSVSSLKLPVPDGECWGPAAGHLARGVRNLMRWAGTTAGAAPKAELLMSVTDLLCLFFTTRIFAWTGELEVAPNVHALLVAPRGEPSSQARAVRAAARATLQRAEGRLREQAKPGPLAKRKQSAALRLPQLDYNGERAKAPRYYNRNWAPEACAATLGASAGWLLPVHAQGGARRYFCPGPTQLRTLVHSLVAPGEEASWDELHHRVWDAYRLCLGDSNARQFSAIGCPEHVVRLAGALNKEQLILYGLARREADNVVMVDGGAR